MRAQHAKVALDFRPLLKTGIRNGQHVRGHAVDVQDALGNHPSHASATDDKHRF